MKFVLKPSLEHMALARIGISLWNQNDISALIAKLRYLYLTEWMEIEERVEKKVPQLPIPQFLKEKVFGVIKPIGMQIFEWMQYFCEYDKCLKSHCLYLDLPAYLPAELCWTSQGTVDRKRTAEVLVEDENLFVSRRYRLACDYFLEDDIIRLWNILPEHFKDYVWDNFPVLSFWSYNMKREEADHVSYKDAFYSSVGHSSKAAARYFLQKLTPEEKEECLKELATHLKDPDVFCFLLCQLQEEEQKEVLKNEPHRVLQCFLQWPWQSFFMDVGSCMWDFFSKYQYHQILLDIIVKVREGYKDYSYQKLFREFWLKSPSAVKDFILNEISNMSSLLVCLFHIKDKENIRIILNHAIPTVKEKLIYNSYIMVCCAHSISDDECDFLEFCIQELLSSKEAMLKFKEEFERFMMQPCFKKHSEIKNQEWNQLFHFSDDSICESGKRNEEGESKFI